MPEPRFVRGHVVLRFVQRDAQFARTLDEIVSVDKNEIVTVQQIVDPDKAHEAGVREWMVIIKTDVATS
jgi:hypothetical protein